ncbi:MAG: peptidoglycan DD-metalloendopeptidase family protein [Gammaproteobacteria bacterium]
MADRSRRHCRLRALEVVTRRLQQLAFLLASVFLLEACSHTGVYTKGYYRRGAAYNPPMASPQKSADYYVVQKGDTLYSIAWQHGQDHREVAVWNNIRPPYTIFPQQRLRLIPPPATTSPRQATVVSKAATSSSAPTKPQPSAAADASWAKKLNWTWPAKGQLVSTFARNDPGRKGVDISGRLGQPVVAAADGIVVYSGSGLRGYGNLLIVKHNEEFFSAYAHNKNNRVKENQKVKAGQQIADMGNSGTDSVKLHFEIRRDGKPVNPLSYLPKQ